MATRVQVWVGARNSRAGTLGDLREVVTQGSFPWSCEDHGYNVGHLIEICGCMLLFLHVFFATKDSMRSWLWKKDPS